MKKQILIPFLFLASIAYSQPKVGFTFGGSLTTNANEMSLIGKAKSYGSEVGITVNFPLYKGLSLETDVLFSNMMYQINGTKRKEIAAHGTYGEFSISTTTPLGYDYFIYGVRMPFFFAYKYKRVRPFFGGYIQQFKTEKFDNGLFDVRYGETRVDYGWINKLNNFNYGVVSGIDFALSKTFDVRFSYSHGLNEFANFTYLAIVNDVEVFRETMSTRVNQYSLSLVYTPEWGKNRNVKKTERRPFKERFKELYK